MSRVKSFSVGHGDMYYIRHGSDNFTVIDCCIPDDREGEILPEIAARSQGKGIIRFISTHPDQDHIAGLVELDDLMQFVNFYCVRNNATKSTSTADFERYCTLRDSDRAYYVSRNCTRKWMNQADDARGSAGINILWPILGNEHHESALQDAVAGLPPNNISCIVKYQLEGGVTMMWMGDLETDFMEKIEDLFELPEVDILFAPHHGRTSGRVPSKWLSEMDPGLIVVGEAPSEYLDYYAGYDVITQNSTGDLLFDCTLDKVHIYAGSHTYVANCLDQEDLDHLEGLYYIGSLTCRT